MLRSSFRSPALAVVLVSCGIACSATPGGSPGAGGTGGGGATAAGGGGTTVIGGAGGTAIGGTGGDILTSTGGAGGGGTATGGGPCASGAGGGSPGAEEICGNGIDENQNGFVDEGCTCSPGAVQNCYPGQGGLCTCEVGQQTCVPDGEFGAWGPCTGAAPTCMGALDPTCEICGNGTDDDCDGEIDEGCVLEVTVNIDGDCVTASCPPQAPYPIGCDIIMDGGDDRGCVANAPGSSVVYFQEGDKCGAGHVGGTLQCSSVPGAPLDQNNCAINKPTKYYPADPSGCPAT